LRELFRLLVNIDEHPDILQCLVLTQVHNDDEQFYVDFAHVTPNGYEHVAKVLAQALRVAPVAN